MVRQMKKSAVDHIKNRFYLENVMSKIPYYIFWKDVHSVYLGCNKKFAELIGKKYPKDVIGVKPPYTPRFSNRVIWI